MLPIFTMGKIFEMSGKSLLPLSIQVHHAVCDGYHVGLFVKNLQDNINDFPEIVHYKKGLNLRMDLSLLLWNASASRQI